jgi:hypothetical protein
MFNLLLLFWILFQEGYCCSIITFWSLRSWFASTALGIKNPSLRCGFFLGLLRLVLVIEESHWIALWVLLPRMKLFSLGRYHGSRLQPDWTLTLDIAPYRIGLVWLNRFPSCYSLGWLRWARSFRTLGSGVVLFDRSHVISVHGNSFLHWLVEASGEFASIDLLRALGFQKLVESLFFS